MAEISPGEKKKIPPTDDVYYQINFPSFFLSDINIAVKDFPLTVFA